MRFNLIKQQLGYNSKPESWFDKLFRSKDRGIHLVQLRLPKYDYFRVSMFVEDLMEVAEYECTFTVSELIAILYEDFLHQVVHGTDQRGLAKKLMVKRDMYLHPKIKIDDAIELSPNHTRFIEREIPKKQPTVMIEQYLPKRTALRGEVLLMDLSSVDERFNLTLEQLLSVLVIDFAHGLKKGNNVKVMNDILQRVISD